MLRLAIALGLAVAAMATAGLGARVLVPRVGDAMARRASVLAAAVPTGDPAADDPGPEVDLGPPVVVEAEPPDAGASMDAGRGVGSGRPAPSEALDIPADRVARLTARQLRGIRATDAVDPAGRPVGARITGAGALGVGLADGDVVTSIDGRPTVNAADATGAAIGAYASGESVAHATLLRQGRTVRVTVHVPAPDGGVRAP
jgi:putative serine protease PepD